MAYRPSVIWLLLVSKNLPLNHSLIICSIPGSGLYSSLPVLQLACSHFIQVPAQILLFLTCYLKKVNSFLMFYLFTLLCFSSSNLHFPKWYYMLVNLFTDYVFTRMSASWGHVSCLYLHICISVPRLDFICVQMKENKLIDWLMNMRKKEYRFLHTVLLNFYSIYVKDVPQDTFWKIIIHELICLSTKDLITLPILLVYFAFHIFFI